jgi:hypothetical protein
MAGQSGTSLGSIIAGLVVAVAAVVPLVWFATDTPESEPGAPADVVVATTAVLPTEVVETVVIVPEPVDVDGLPESIVRTLEAAGNVRNESGDELGLPPSVIDVLADNDVVLRVAEEPSP